MKRADWDVLIKAKAVFHGSHQPNLQRQLRRVEGMSGRQFRKFRKALRRKDSAEVERILTAARAKRDAA